VNVVGDIGPVRVKVTVEAAPDIETLLPCARVIAPPEELAVPLGVENDKNEGAPEPAILIVPGPLVIVMPPEPVKNPARINGATAAPIRSSPSRLI
jgi:hypothetical protein